MRHRRTFTGTQREIRVQEKQDRTQLIESLNRAFGWRGKERGIDWWTVGANKRREEFRWSFFFQNCYGIQCNQEWGSFRSHFFCACLPTCFPVKHSSLPPPLYGRETVTMQRSLWFSLLLVSQTSESGIRGENGTPDDSSIHSLVPHLAFVLTFLRFSAPHLTNSLAHFISSLLPFHRMKPNTNISCRRTVRILVHVSGDLPIGFGDGLLDAH